MKKIISIVAAVLVMAMFSVCSATLPNSEAALGGIAVGSTRGYVESVYGPPSSSNTERDGYTYAKYGSNLEFVYSGDLLFAIDTHANNGFSTPRGIHVGSSVNDLKNAYAGERIGYDSRENAYVILTEDRSTLSFYDNGDKIRRIVVKI